MRAIIKKLRKKNLKKNSKQKFRKSKAKDLKLVKGNIGKKVFNVTILVTTICMVLVVFINILFFNILFKEIGSELSQKTKNARTKIAVGDIKNIAKEVKTGTADYKKIKNDLIQIRNNENVNDVYILSLDEDNDFAKTLVNTESHLLNVGKRVELNNDLKKAFSGEDIILKELTEKDSIKVLSSFYPIEDSNGEVIAIIGLDQDVTYLKRAEQIIISELIVLAIVLIIIYSIVIGVISKRITKNVKKLTSSLEVMADGDLSKVVKVNSGDELELISDNINDLRLKLSDMVGQIVSAAYKEIKSINSISLASEEVAASSQQVSATIQEIDSNIIVQNDETIEISKLVEKFGESIQEVVESINHVHKSMELVNEKVFNSKKEYNQLQESKIEIQETFIFMESKLNGLYELIKRIEGITKFIDSIADQTNLLALNASIEASRAGEAGRGFAVVANEIRKLAEEVKNSSIDITRLLNSVIIESNLVEENATLMSNKLENQYVVINNSVENFEDIMINTTSIIPKMRNINSKMENVNNKKEDIVVSIENIKSFFNALTKSSEEIRELTENLSDMSEGLASIGCDLKLLTDEKSKMTEQFITE